MSLANKIAKSKAEWERKPYDLYPTPPELTKVLVDDLVRKGYSLQGAKVREPCCGEGHISYVLEQAGAEVTSSDIRHTGYGQGGVDYLETKDHGEYYEYDMVITNPPFSHAAPFIRRAFRDAPIVAMVLPSGYWHAARRAGLFRAKPPRYILAPTWRPAFLEEERGKSPLMNVIWTLWTESQDGYGSPWDDKTFYYLVDRPLSYPRIPPPTSAMLVGRTGKLDLLESSLTANTEARR